VKSTFISYLLWFLGGLGVLGLHRFYLGRWVTGLLWLFTGGIFFVGAIIDLFLIPEMVRVENVARHLISQDQSRSA
jgi:TM2 domain-containing membrane protein YozV